MKEKGVFINIPDIGNLYIYDVLVSYICPISFVCVDDYETKYLFYEITDEQEYIEWLVSKITKKEYYSIIDKKIPIQNGYKKSGFLRKVKKTYEGDLVACELIGKNELTLLPVDDVFAEKKAVEDNFNAQTLLASRESGMTTFDVRLYAGTDRHSVPHTIMQGLCSDFNSLVSSVFGYKRVDQINVCTVAGSCVIRFSFPDQINLFNDSNAIQETNVINEILSEPSINVNVQKVADKKKFVSSYTGFLNTIKKTGSDVEFITASPNSSEVKDINLRSYHISQRYEAVKNIYKETKETIVVEGTLTALDTIKYKFKFTADNGDLFDGSLEKKNFDDVYKLPSKYIATIEVTKKVDENSFTEKKSYLLKELKAV